jgi:hypothetical protein
VLPVEARDGYLLLQHIDPSEPTASSCNPELPPPFFAFAYATPPPSATQVSVMYAGALQLMAYELDSRQVDQEDHQPLTITTYWRALKPVTQPLTAVITLTRPNGTRYVTTSLLQQPWLPPDQWQPGATIRMQTSPLYLRAEDRGELLLGVEVRAGAPEAAPSVSAAVPALITKPAPSGINHLPRLANKGTSALLAVVQVV